MTNTIVLHITDHNGQIFSLDAKIGKTLMEVATAKNIQGIAADCGGQMTCATCHVFVEEPYASRLGLPNAAEWSMLTFTATPRQPNSRLSCQITLSADLNGLHVKLPATQY